MIFILSDENDQSTNEVIDWIYYYNEKSVRINSSDTISCIQVDSDFEFSFLCGDKKIESKNISSFWYRRGYLNVLTKQIEDSEILLSEVINKHLRLENFALRNFILRALAKKRSLGDYFNTDVDKLEVLKKAKDIGLRIPETIVTTSKQELKDFLTKHNSIITKSSGEVIIQVKDGISVISYTKRIGLEEVLYIDETFSSSLFQEEIKKRYELRVFFINEKFYSMAIFSQLDNQTAVDFRVYNRAKPNRMVPYSLPNEITSKLSKLMQNCGYNTGSIDMMVTEDNQFYFLEINPVGQFDMVSSPCNYHLHKQIAMKLCF